MSVLAALLLAPALTIGGDDAVRLLARVAEAYSAHGYSVEVSGTLKVESREISRRFRLTLASGSAGLFAKRTRAFTLLATPEGTWAHSERHNRYTANPGRTSLEELKEINKLHDRFVRRFAHLSPEQFIVIPRGTGTVNRVRCVRLKLKAVDNSWDEELWVDPRQAVVLKSVHRTRMPPPDLGYRVTKATWRAIRLNEEPPAELFEFRPPAGAKRTNRLPDHGL